jgi:hypothetical protein
VVKVFAVAAAHPMKWFISMMTLCASTREKTERYRAVKQEEI